MVVETAVLEVSTISEVASEMVTLSVICPGSSVTSTSAACPIVTVTFDNTDFLKFGASAVIS
jgi:hypothetical protein